MTDDEAADIFRKLASVRSDLIVMRQEATVTQHHIDRLNCEVKALVHQLEILTGAVERQVLGPRHPNTSPTAKN